MTEGKVQGQAGPMTMTTASQDPMSAQATDSVVTSLGQLEAWVTDRVRLKYPVNEVPLPVVAALTKVQARLAEARVEFQALVDLVKG